jgi:predicted nucleic acid-binding protein
VVLLDTNVISELIKPRPNPGVVAYIHRLDPDSVFTAAICEAEIRYGLARMPEGRRRDDLIVRVDEFFEEGFQDQILRFDRVCASVYGEIRHGREAVGKQVSVEDAMIAATARAYGAQEIATRDIRDFADCGVAAVDPWVAE